ncbi:MAG: hypothetical protein RIR39_2350 [Pseudomonadota bacterium]
MNDDMNDSVETGINPNVEISELRREDLDGLLNKYFAGRVVRKDLTKQLKEGANVPVYVLEYLLGMYCASDDDEVVSVGMENVKRILTENYVRPDEAEKIKSLIRVFALTKAQLLTFTFLNVIYTTITR